MAKKAPTLPKLGYGQGTMVYREKSNEYSGFRYINCPVIGNQHSIC